MTKQFRVFAFNDFGDSDPSNVAIPVSVLMAPSNLIALSNGTDHELTWIDNSNNETGFRIEANIDSGGWETLATVGADVESYTVETLLTETFSDTFTNSDGTLISDHVPDQNPNGNPWEYRRNDGNTTTGEFEIHNNAASMAASGWNYTNWQMATIDTGFSGAEKITFEGIIRPHVTDTRGSNGFWFAGTSNSRAGNGYMVLLYNSNELRVVRYNSGSGTNLVIETFNYTDDTDYLIRVEIDGDVIDVYVDNVFITSVTDGTHRGGYCGYQIWYPAQGYATAKLLDSVNVTKTFSLGDNFEYRVIAVNDAGNSDPSNVAVPEVATFNPNNIPDLVAWISTDGSTLADGSNTPITPTNGDTVNIIRNDLVNAHSDYRMELLNGSATFAADALGDGKDAIDIPSNAYYRLRDNTSTDVDTGGGGNKTLFLVAASQNSNNFRWGLSTFTGGDDGYGLLLDTRTQRRLVGALQSVGNQRYANMDVRDATLNIRLLTTRGTGVSGNLDGWKNGVLTADSPVSLHTYQYDTNILALGEGFNTTGSDIYVYEALMFARDLTDAEVGQVNDYLTDKYGL